MKLSETTIDSLADDLNKSEALEADFDPAFDIIRPALSLPDYLQAGDQVLLHTCCAPCSCEIMAAMRAVDLMPVLLFYNPNIHPKTEYLRRKEENKTYADQFGIKFIDADYTPSDFFDPLSILADEPERGLRCSGCFHLGFCLQRLGRKKMDFQFLPLRLL